jgi:aerobic-type carbon monoxide dehydrogenase small subunit (CoxS/CutS family)
MAHEEFDGVSRRSFIQTLGVSAATTTMAASARAIVRDSAARKAAEDAAPAVLGPGDIDLTLTINGTPSKVKVEPGTTLLDALRVHLGKTGSKEVCDRGACGACSVIADGKLVASCMMLAADAEGMKITTVEGLEKSGKLDPVQEAFIRHDALQCGYCTPGLLMAARAMLDTLPKPTMDEIKKYLAGNICRCGTYTNVFNAVLEASGQAVPQDGAAGGAR